MAMTAQDYEQTSKALAAMEKKITASPEAARAFLVKMGVLTADGKPTDRYRHLCTPANLA
jgi:hypothetical protein